MDYLARRWALLALLAFVAFAVAAVACSTNDQSITAPDPQPQQASGARASDRGDAESTGSVTEPSTPETTAAARSPEQAQEPQAPPAATADESVAAEQEQPATARSRPADEAASERQSAGSSTDTVTRSENSDSEPERGARRTLAPYTYREEHSVDLIYVDGVVPFRRCPGTPEGYEPPSWGDFRLRQFDDAARLQQLEQYPLDPP